MIATAFTGVQAGSGSGTVLGLIYVTSSNRTYVRNADISFEIILEGGDYRTAVDDFLFG